MILDEKNLDLKNIVTPVDAQNLEQFLIETGYKERKRKYIIDGFTNGFVLHFEGKLNGGRRFAPNLKLREWSLRLMCGIK